MCFYYDCYVTQTKRERKKIYRKRKPTLLKPTKSDLNQINIIKMKQNLKKRERKIIYNIYLFVCLLVFKISKLFY